MLYLRNLNESLEKKYALHEAYDESFPRWFKNGLNSSIENYGAASLSISPRQGYAASNQRHSRYNTQVAPVTTFKKDRGDTRHDWDVKSEESLFNKAREIGIDMQNTHMEEAPVPTSSSDPLLKDDSILRIWGFPNGQVYIEGVNDNEKYLDDPKQRPFIWVSMKSRIGLANHFGYIKKDDLKPGIYSEKDAYRNKVYSGMSNMYAEHPEMANMNSQEGKHFTQDQPYDPETRANNYGSYEKDKLDKSGYLVSPKRYEEPLKKAKAGRIFNVLDGIHEQIESIYDNFINTIDVLDPFNGDADLLSGFDRASLQSAIRSYNAYAKHAEKIANDFNAGALTEDGALSAFKYILDDIGHDTSLKELNKMSNDLYSSVNWLM